MKKPYSPPEIRTHELDTRISLIQQSQTTDTQSLKVEQTNYPSETLSEDSLEKDHPFQESSFDE